MFAMKPDYEEVLARFEGWWECEIVDRPIVSITYPKPAQKQRPVPEMVYASWRERKERL